MIYFCVYCQHDLREKPLRVDGYRLYAHLNCYEIETIGEK